ncbi:MAG: response regulator [Verrucomicrobiales bacterium]|nr:response regulator [Verrucomicrobiales bacterium]
MCSAILCLRLFAPYAAPGQAPVEILDQAWKVASLLPDSGLAKKNLFNLDFVRDKSSPRHGTAWIAASDGLYEYDGYSWRRYSKSNGLPSDFVRCVRIVQNGQLWVGTDRGAGTFDGRNFVTHGSESGLAGPNVRRIDQDPDGTIWFCSDSWPNGEATGGITSWKEGRWRAFHKQDGLPNHYVVDHLRDSHGRHFAATLSGLAELKGDRWSAAFTPPTSVTFQWRSSSLAESARHGVMYSAGHEVFLSSGAEWRQITSDHLHHSGICSTSDGEIVTSGIVEGGRHAFLEWTADGWRRRSASFVVPMGYHEDVQEAPDGSLWLLGYDCLVRWQRRGAEWQEYANLSEPLFTDGQGGLWFGRLLDRQRNTAPVRHVEGTWERSERIYDQLICSRDGKVWGWNRDEIVSWEDSLTISKTLPRPTLASIQAGALDRQGALWLVGAASDSSPSASRFDGTSWVTRALTELPGTILPSRICGAANGVWIIAEGSADSEDFQLARLEMNSLQIRPLARAVVSRFRFGMHCDSAGSLWLYGDAGLFRLRNGPDELFESVTNVPARHVFGCLERGSELWFGFSGTMGGQSGLARLQGETWTLYAVDAPLNLSLAADGTLMAGGKGVLTLVPPSPEPNPITIEVPGDTVAKGVAKAPDGSYWLGDDTRVLRFKPDRLPPRTSIQLSQTKLLRGDSIQVTAVATERYQPRENRRDHLFSWKIDDGQWSPFRAGHTWKIATADLRAGPHRVEVRSLDAGMDLDPQPAVAALQVFPIPIQSRRWFSPALVGSLLLVTLLATVAWRAKAQLALHAHRLEAVVRERTAELQADLEQRKRMAEDLRITEEKFSKAFHSSPIALAIRRLADNRFIEVNSACEKLTGYPAPELLGHSAAELKLQVVTTGPHEAPADSTAARGYKEKEIQLRTQAGEVRSVLESAEIISVGGNACALTTLMDVTERRLLEEQLRQSQKLEAIGTLAGGIAHDFNNILSAVAGYAELTRLELGANHPATDNLDHISKASNRAKSLVQQLLSFSRPQPQARRIIALQSVIEESVGLLRATLPAGIELATSIHDNAPPVLADANQIHQVLLNLCTNATHAIESGAGKIEISLRGMLLDSEQISKLPGLQVGWFACLAVTDSGTGMDATLIPRIFEPFFTTKATGHGTGLGLSVVHGIMKSHDGGILVTSKPGLGTTFQLFFPKAQGSPEGIPAENRIAPRGDGQRILYLDDEDVLVDLAKRILERLGYSVTGFTDATQAIEAFRLSAEDYDVVVTDLNMPGFSGLKVAEQVLKIRPDVPVILSSGHVTEEIQSEARRIGVIQVLYKPNTMEELGASVHRLIKEMKPR